MSDEDVAPGDPVAVTGRHYKTGEERTVLPEDLDGLGHRLGVHAAAGYGYWMFAMSGLFAASDAPWMPTQDDVTEVVIDPNHGSNEAS